MRDDAEVDALAALVAAQHAPSAEHPWARAGGTRIGEGPGVYDGVVALPWRAPDVGALIAEVQRLRGALAAVIGLATCGDPCAARMKARAEQALADDGDTTS